VKLTRITVKNDCGLVFNESWCVAGGKDGDGNLK